MNTALEEMKQLAIIENSRHLDKNGGRRENYGLSNDHHKGGCNGKSDEKKLEDLDYSIKVLTRELSKMRDKITRLKRRKDAIISTQHTKNTY